MCHYHAPAAVSVETQYSHRLGFGRFISLAKFCKQVRICSHLLEEVDLRFLVLVVVIDDHKVALPQIAHHLDIISIGATSRQSLGSQTFPHEKHLIGIIILSVTGEGPWLRVSSSQKASSFAPALPAQKYTPCSRGRGETILGNVLCS